jgi:hypothetical protein
MEIFVEAGYNVILEEEGEIPKFNFKRVARDLVDLQDLIMTLKQKAMDQQYPSDENLEPEEEDPEGEEPEGEEPPAPEAGMPPPEAGAPNAEEEMPPEEEEGPQISPQRSQDEIVADLTELEQVVADLASELGMGSNQEGEGSEEELEPELEPEEQIEPPPQKVIKKKKAPKGIPTETEEQ